MLYVFYVDVGKRLALDMNLVNESVLHLKHSIEQSQHIPSNKQVLLISGGECLEDTAKVCSYSAGTDTNPIYLFNRTFLERSEAPCINTDYKSNSNSDLNQLHERIENFNTQKVTFYSIDKVNELAQKYLLEARNTAKFCDDLNTDQLLQQQGLAAAIANMDDVLVNFKSQCESFDSSYMRYLESREKNIDLINSFSEDLNVLSKIPLLPALLEGNEEERARLEACYDKSRSNNVSLLEWISAKDPEESLENVKSCQKTLERYDEKALLTLREDIQTLFHPDRLRALHNNSDISEKLMTLSGLIVTIKSAFEDQEKKADGISLNHRRATDLKDDTILPDLLETHKDTLRSMKANHTNLRSCRQLCIQSKKELCDIIHNRLKSIMLIQQQAAEIRSILVLQGAYMKRLRGYIELIQQIHTTPRNYLAAVAEVVRRRSYSQAFLMWASDLACRIYAMYADETDRRKKFLSQFQGHFLHCLFPGLDDMPPMFATHSPPLFDNNLPPLCEDDLIQLFRSVPDLGSCTSMPDVNAIRNFFLSKSLTLSEVNIQNDSEVKITSSVVDEMALMAKEEIDDNNSACDKNEIQTQDMITSYGSNFDMPNTGSAMECFNEIEKIKYEEELCSMRDRIATLGTVAHKTVISLRNDLSSLKGWMYSHQTEITNTVQIFFSQIQEQQTLIKNLFETVNEKDDKIKLLYLKISEIENERLEEDSNEKIEKRIDEAVQKERERTIKEVSEQLNRNHKIELEGLRQRFKLMACTNMERCPSETSLEKFERNEFTELPSHGVLMNQLRHDMEMQINRVKNEERSTYERKLEEETTKFASEKLGLTDTIKASLIEDFSKQLESMRIRETTLLSELQRHKETIHTLTDPEGGSYSLLSRIEELEREKNRLQSELINERKMKYSFSSSSQSNPTDSGGSTTSLTSNSSSPELQNRPQPREPMNYEDVQNRGPSSYLGHVRICLQSCNVGDHVLVVWDDVQRNYTILQDSKTLYFLHPNSIDVLRLRPASDGSPRKLYCPAEVIEKEYCAPKKIINRYNVKEGERFYRVKVKPIMSVIRTT